MTQPFYDNTHPQEAAFVPHLRQATDYVKLHIDPSEHLTSIGFIWWSSLFLLGFFSLSWETWIISGVIMMASGGILGFNALRSLNRIVTHGRGSIRVRLHEDKLIYSPRNLGQELGFAVLFVTSGIFLLGCNHPPNGYYVIDWFLSILGVLYIFIGLRLLGRRGRNALNRRKMNAPAEPRTDQ